MNIGITNLISNVGVSFEWIIMIIAVVAILPFAARSFQLAIIILVTEMAGLYIWFKIGGLNYSLPLILFFMAIVILALSSIPTSNTSTTGGFT